MIVAGIDTGNPVGLVALEFPDYPRLDRARWIDATSVSASHKDRPTRDLALHAKVREWLTLVRPAVVALEEPIDARPFWQKGKGRPESGETRFRQGAHYTLAELACAYAVPTAQVVAYPVKGRKGVAGWMGTMTHLQVVAMGQRFVRATHGPAHLLEWAESRDHQLMALGVLLYHVSRPVRLARPAA